MNCLQHPRQEPDAFSLHLSASPCTLHDGDEAKAVSAGVKRA